MLLIYPIQDLGVIYDDPIYSIILKLKGFADCDVKWCKDERVDSSFPTWAIVLCAVGGALLLLLIIIYIIKKKKSSKKDEDKYVEIDEQVSA